MATGRMVRWASCGAVAFILAGCGGTVAQAPKPVVAPAPKPASITDVQVSGTGDDVQVTVVTSAKVAYSLVRQSTSPRLSLQLTGAAHAGTERVIPVHRGVVTEIRSSASGTDAKVEVFLSAEARYDVEGLDTGIILKVSPKAPAPVPKADEQRAPIADATAVPAAPVITTAVEEPPVPPPIVSSGPRALTAIDVNRQADGLVVTLQGNGPLKHNYFLVEGRSLVVDITGAANKVLPMKKKVDDAWVSQIRIGQHDQPKKFIRVVFDLKKTGEHLVQSFDNRIVVSFGAPALEAERAAGSGGGNQAAPTALNTVRQVSCGSRDAVVRLEISTAATPDFAIVDSGDPAKIIVEIAGAKIADKDIKTIDLASQNLDVVKVTTFPYAKGDAQFVRVVAQLRRPVRYSARVEGTRVVVDFEKSATTATAGQTKTAAAAPAPPTAAPTAASAPVAASIASAVVPAAAVPAAAPAPAAAAAPAPAAPAVPAVPAPVAQPSGTVEYTGRRLSLDFKDADVNDILRLISEVSGLNFIAGSEVTGKVSIKLADVPWDQALDLILKTNVPQLAQVRESENIVRITTTDKIMDEEQRRRRLEEDKKKTADAQEALEPLVTKSYSLSYAETMSAVATQLTKFLSPRGKVESDERTKTLIVKDVAGTIGEIERVISTLDAQTPAVLVEARIVQMDTNSGRELGVQWGGSFNADNEHGNGTKYAFPNSINVAGTAGGVTAGLVNLPANATTSGIGIKFGHIANVAALDLRLSAMETMRKSKTLSSPRVLVLHNKEAKIHVGLDLPQATTDIEGKSSITYQSIGITLQVTPKVTNDKRVVMKITVGNDGLGAPVNVGGSVAYQIDKREAVTEVIVKDGETTVIGGMYEETSSDGEGSVPGLSKIPILGYLFKSNSRSLRRTELMIFITPRIVVM